MKTIEYPLDNTGGLSYIYAIPESAYKQTGYTSSGGRKLELYATGGVICIPCLYSRFDFSEERQESDSGDLYEIIVSGFIYGITGDNSETVEKLRNGAWLVMTKDIDGMCLLAGSNNVRMIFEYQTSTGKGRAALKGTAFEFKCTDQYPAIILAEHPF
ncbi:MAG: hypothetical protein LBU37_14765 [Tannerellaceae bacterium]|jgi:hypothetical protein|nr:hypothetical protein [Tannerellaceae bacterium]